MRKCCVISPLPQPLSEKTTAMPFDSVSYAPARQPAAVPAARLIDAAPELCPEWAQANPDRALALLFVAPRDCAAVDALTALED
jgi:hypothetical protein